MSSNKLIVTGKKRIQAVVTATTVASGLLGICVRPARASVVYVGADSANSLNWNDPKNWSTGNTLGGTNTVLFDDAAFNLSEVLTSANTFSGGYTARGGTTIVANNQSLGSFAGAQVSGTSSTGTASLLTASGITLGQNITVASSVNTAGAGGAALQYGATIGGAPGQTGSVWTGISR